MFRHFVLLYKNNANSSQDFSVVGPFLGITLYCGRRRNEQLLDDVIGQVLVCLTTYTYQDLQ